MRRQWVLTSAAVVLLAILGGAVAVYRMSAARKQPAPAAPSKPAVFAGNEATVTGTIQARKTVSVAAPVAGVIDAVFAEPGQEVTQGQLLARIKSGQMEGAVELASAELERMQSRVTNTEEALVAERLESSRASADLTRAKSDFERLEKAFRRQELLLKEGATPRLVYEKAQREYESAKQEFENKQTLAQQAESRMDALSRDLDADKRALEEKTSALDQAKAHAAAGDVVSPVDGLVVARSGSAGDQITPGAADFFQIAVELGSLEVVLNPDPTLLARLRPGQAAVVHVAEFPEDLSGAVREIRGTQAIVEFASPSPVVKPGMTAAVRIRLI